jgi:peptidoglycan hydrolase CwlO-like protein
MLFRTGNAPNPDNTVDLVVKSSHANPSHTELCSPQAHVKVQLAELQEMYNHKKDLLAEGEQKQAELMGKKRGLPKGPDPKQTQLAQGRVDPDTAAAVAELKQMMADADDTEKEVSAVGTTGS